jgi:hypothetical protein
VLKFDDAVVKSVTANVAKKTISFSFTVTLDDESMQAADALAFYVGKTALKVTVDSRQMTLAPDKEV